MAFTFKKRNGKTVTLLNPAEKGQKCAAELRAGVHATNDGMLKRDNNGNPIPLTDTEKSWRSGYLAARKDSAACYNAKNGIKNKKQKRGKRVQTLPAEY